MDNLESFSSIEQLQQAIHRYEEELIQIKGAEEDLAMRNYRAFISTSEVLESMKKPLHNFSQAVDGFLTSDLPQLEGLTHSFSENVASLTKAYERNQNTLHRQSALFELVELPQLMESFVQRGAQNIDAYEQALAIYTYSLQLESLYPDLPLVRRIVAAIRASALLLASELHQLLRSPIQLAVCLRIIGFLRRLRLSDEPSLRATFLACRDVHLAGLLAAIDHAAGPYVVGGRLVDVSRGALFDIITQYRAIFIDDAASADALHVWVAGKVAAFCAQLGRVLAAVAEGSHVSALLDQSMYFAMSMGRVGADFRPQLAPMFVAAARRVLASGLADGLNRFLLAAQQYNWPAQPRLSAYYAGKSAYGPHDPPTMLLQYPPLAAFCNDCLATFNQFRHCAILQLEQFSRDHLGQVLAQVSDTIHQLDATQFSSPEIHAQLRSATTDTLIPFLQRVLNRIWQPDPPTPSKSDTPIVKSELVTHENDPNISNPNETIDNNNNNNNNNNDNNTNDNNNNNNNMIHNSPGQSNDELSKDTSSIQIELPRSSSSHILQSSQLSRSSVSDL